ncbi:MAG: SpoIIE family protein phosphatase [Lachnospiraceae bacterium]|jgi:stage II sporulation protein E|nr:SpoIIE family protein phosphatase [Lachnospiraceae bacterium]
MRMTREEPRQLHKSFRYTAGKKAEEGELQTAQVSELCRRKLLNYADTFYELARNYDREFNPGKEDRQTLYSRRQLWENRQVIKCHLNEAAKIMTELACEVLCYRPMEEKQKKRIVRALKEEGIQVENPCYVPDEQGTESVVLTMSTDKASGIPGEEAADMLTVLLGRRLRLSVVSPCVIEKTPHSFVLEEQPRFLALTGFARAIKEDETISGDNYSVLEVEKGRLVMMLSDGTGSGERAGQDSGKVLDLMEKMMETGYSVEAAVKMVNTALFALGEDQNHPTLDVCDLDLHKGAMELRKAGGAVTFLKRQSETEALTVGNLPLGIFQQVEVQPVCRNLQDGDYVIMVSDGVVDAFEEAYEDALLQAVEAAETQNPGGMAEWLLRAALRAGKGRVKDDMTIGVIGIWEVCP